MKIIDKLNCKQKDMYGKNSITIAFLGDSCTQGCFECYFKHDDFLETVYDYKSAYSTRVREILNMLYPNVQINIINSGISGDTAYGGINRLERDVLRFSPDLVIISFGLNDCVSAKDGDIGIYIESLKNIFIKCKEIGIECVLLTECMMNYNVSPFLTDKRMIEIAERLMKIQKSGLIDNYFESAKKTAQEFGVAVCDQYSVWKTMRNAGIDTTELLANRLNHPIREFHYYIAIKLIETIFEK